MARDAAVGVDKGRPGALGAAAPGLARDASPPLNRAGPALYLARVGAGGATAKRGLWADPLLVPPLNVGKRRAAEARAREESTPTRQGQR